MNIFKKFKANEARSVITGAPFVIGTDDNGNDAIIYIARAHHSNPEYKAEIDRLMQQHQSKLNNLSKDKDKAAHTKFIGELVELAIKRTCIKAWSDNITDENNLPLLYSEASIEKLWADLPDLVDDIVSFAINSANYVGSFDEEESLKN